ncbi:VOC family protein [Pseudohalocynthiibacter aestuariivivens]|uniref:VOC family protein n=1 Tax=Pseudohalocynthiibacter aestuariivivens TaxID=1591409 RepID=A0ABV5JHD5_9RHOB|nr:MULTISPECIES: VOC family protein [Pseudohalocynthiibacter]MBS9715425.1 VOC family protein [Pseudohalocynthiibacter aestuariivivens]MCK0102629.1 VOC family protein [Pseudohalocynthiibacter sp. F2068]
MAPKLTSLDHLVLTVRNIEQTTDFYTEVLGMTAEEFYPSDGSRRTALKFGKQKINLHLAGAEFEPKAQAPVSGSADLCFLSDVPLPEWEAYLTASGIPIEDGSVARNGATGPIQSLYIRDPDGNLIEISNKV